MVPPKDAIALADGVVHSLSNMQNSKKMAEQGRKFVNDNFDVNKMVDDIDTLYDTLI